LTWTSVAGVQNADPQIEGPPCSTTEPQSPHQSHRIVGWLKIKSLKSVVYNPGIGGAGAGGLYPGQVPGGMMSNQRHKQLN